MRLRGGNARFEAKARAAASWLGPAFEGFDTGLGGTYAVTLPWGHTLAAMVDLSLSLEGSVWDPQASAAVTYGVPFGIPVSRRPNTATVAGKVYHAGTGEGMP